MDNNLRDYDDEELNNANEDFVKNEDSFNKESEPEGESIHEDIEDDYKEIDKLDNYDDNELDNKSYSDISANAKLNAEKYLNKRDKQENLNNKGNMRMPLAYNDDFSMQNSLNDSNNYERRKELQLRNFIGIGEEDEEIYQEDEDDFNINMDEIKGNIQNWINDSRTQIYIKKIFRRFLISFEEDNVKIYKKKIDKMVEHNEKSLEIVYDDLSSKEANFAYWIFDTPNIILPILNKTAYEYVWSKYPFYKDISKEVYVKLTNFPLDDNLRDLRTIHLNSMVKVAGVITKRYKVHNQLKKVVYRCKKCSDRKVPIYLEDIEFRQNIDKLGQCDVCQNNGQYYIDSEESVYGNHQKIIVQESPNSVIAGRIPRQKEVILLNDNIDCARPGDEVEITGIYQCKIDYRMNIKYGFPVFSTFIEANNVKKLNDIQMGQISNIDKEEIIKLSKNKDIVDIIIRSIASSIYGHYHIKTAMALAMFGGENKIIENHYVRGDINVLLLGDPGLAKSQFLKYVEKTFYRTIYTTGKGASAVGLTAAVTKDPVSNEWTLEGGALVLADKGICLIDEFDKMTEIDRTSIHEAMEQQSISISKAGINTSLKARCSVIAAANPIKGRYDNTISFSDNVNLSEPILSRFDILCVVKDDFDQTKDADLASFIINSHIKNHPVNKNDDENEENKNQFQLLNEDFYDDSYKISNELLKKYIFYARNNIKTVLTNDSKVKIQNFYATLREESRYFNGINIVPRHLESLIRMAHASAKMRLNTHIQEKDIDLAISVMLESFIQSQRESIAKDLRKKFYKYIRYGEDINSILMKILGKLVNQQIEWKAMFEKEEIEDITIKKMVKIEKKVLITEAKERNINSIDKFLESRFFKRNYILKGDFIIKYYN